MPEPYYGNEDIMLPRRRRRWLVLGLLAACIAVLAVADSKWEWRDYLRRLIEGEDLPAFRAAEWQDARAVRETLRQRLTVADPRRELEEKATRRDLALYTIIASAGDSALSRSAPELHAFMEELSANTDWLEEIAYGMPLEHAAGGLRLLASLYLHERSGITSFPECRRFATALAFACARAGLDESATMERYRFYVAGSQRYRLNAGFEGLAIWEMSVIAAQGLDARWGELDTLAWFQDNVRLPAQEYPRVADSLAGNARSLFGVMVGTEEFYTLYRDSVESGMARVCADSGCSTPRDRAGYAAAAACANGVPAVVVGAGEQAQCLVDVKGRWVGSADLPEGAVGSWSLWEHKEVDFLRLIADIGRGSEVSATMDACRLAGMGSYLLSQGNAPQGQELLRAAIKAQPLYYPAWRDYLASGAPKGEAERAAQLFAAYPAVQQSLAAAAAAVQP